MTIIAPHRVSWTVDSLPETMQEILLTRHTLANPAEYREDRGTEQGLNQDNGGLFAAFDYETDEPVAEVADNRIVWGTDNYVDQGASYDEHEILHDVSVIRPRAEKSVAEQRRRAKDKAEVFTPTWLCNLQNNLVDDELLYPGAFNIQEHSERDWTPTEQIDFDKVKQHGGTAKTWRQYVMEKRLEVTCGEGPYLMSPYDAVTGTVIPVRDEQGRFQRIGILDRKLRVVTENAPEDQWTEYALLALHATFGFEWQGDNLLLARLNMVNTFAAYYEDYYNEAAPKGLLMTVADIASWNLWQMDGLKMVAPMTCSDKCTACEVGTWHGHDGEVALVRVFGDIMPFEDFLLN